MSAGGHGDDGLLPRRWLEHVGAADPLFFTAGLAAARPKAMRSAILGKGAVVVLAAGMLGMATG
ncbi:MAG: hypothetical protein WKG00_07955 [Polyangiaceae bacterium]